MARRAASDAQQEVSAMESGAVGAVKYSHFPPKTMDKFAFLLKKNEVSSLTGSNRQNLNFLHGFIHFMRTAVNPTS